MNKSTSLLHLSLIPGIGPATVEKLLTSLPDREAQELYALKKNDLVALNGLTTIVAEKIVSGLAQRDLLEKELERIERHAISWTSSKDADYPALLKTIHLPPIILYWRGAHPASFEKCLAIVGSRNANRYAFNVIKRLIPEFIARDWCIISGGARGADALAHITTLEHRGATIAVLGSGLLKPYPAQNSKLFQEIAEKGGSVLSSFPLLATAQAGNFPARNRIIAGLCQGCLVVQAAARSGALITAHYSLDQGREVGAVPGSIEDELSAGCHALIQQGAHLISQAQDMIHILEGGLPSLPISQKPRETADSIKTTLLQLCALPTAFDELIEKTALDPSFLHEKLFSLQIEGSIEQNFMGLWHSCRIP